MVNDKQLDNGLAAVWFTAVVLVLMEEEKLHGSNTESPCKICIQVMPSCLLAGLGMVTAGILLDQVQVSDPSGLSRDEDKFDMMC